MEFIRRLESNDLDNFIKVFRVFEGEPFYEAWTEDEYISEFVDFLENGEMYGIFLEDQICGLITIKKNYVKWGELDADIFDKAIYLSDIAVCENARNKGLGSKLMNYIVSEFGDEYDIYMRTNVENSMSEGIAVKNGFEVIDGYVETVSFKRTRDDIPEVDQRKYLIRTKDNDKRRN